VVNQCEVLIRERRTRKTRAAVCSLVRSGDGSSPRCADADSPRYGGRWGGNERTPLHREAQETKAAHSLGQDAPGQTGFCLGSIRGEGYPERSSYEM
jgi:hypothetical protein